MDLITTHRNADFDALGSVIAARKLYPNSRLLLPGSQEEAVRNFLSMVRDIIPIESERECRLDDVDRLIIVDTRHASRIGAAASLIKKKGLEIIVYDHHPWMRGDIRADKDVYEDVGASVSIIADIIRKRHIRLSPLEATAMLLGIYEETGSLTYRSTTKLDVDIVSFLLSHGASLSAVSGYLNRELKDNELAVFTRLINSTERVSIKGFNIAVACLGEGDHSVEMGLLINKLIGIENLPAVFVIADAGKGRIDIIARSAISALDVNKVLSGFGGGGHPGAAAATIRESDMKTVKSRLIKAVKSRIKTKICAGDIMSRHVMTIDAGEKITAARELLLGAGLAGIIVTEGRRITGIFSIDGANKAMKQGFGHSRVKGYMSRKVVRVSPTTPLHKVTAIMRDENVMIVPVTSGMSIKGVINRRDILKYAHNELFTAAPQTKKEAVVSLVHKMELLLPGDIMKLLRDIGNMGVKAGCRTFVVGGLVRDLLLGVKNLDLDIVVEGDAIRFGGILSSSFGWAMVEYRKFGTCSVFTKGGLKIDLATARREIYEQPGALPTVSFGSLREDLLRRDFTINAMAISLDKGTFGRLIDFFGGEADLASGRIRVLHNKSFTDDPTRIFRAVRFEQRFGFKIDRRTEELIRNAIDEKMFEKVKSQRIRDEIILILKEEYPLLAIRRMSELDELRFLHHAIKLNSRIVKLFKAAGGACRWYDSASFRKRALDRWLVYLMALMDDLRYNEISSVCDKFAFRRGERIRLLSYKKLAGRVIKTLSGTKEIKPCRIHKLLEPLSLEVTLLMMAKGRSSRPAVSRIKAFLEYYNGKRIMLRGENLERLGLKPSPLYKDIFEKVLCARLDGRVKTKKDELAYAARLIRVKKR